MSDREIVELRKYDPVGHSRLYDVHTGSDSLVQQHLKDEVDVNVIVRRFGITGSMPAGQVGGVFGDFTGISDFESAVAAIDRARNGFMTLPPEIREKFNNDPGMLIEYANGVPFEELDAELKAALAPPAPVPPEGGQGG